MALEVLNELTEDVANIDTNIQPELKEEESSSNISTESLLSKYVISEEKLHILNKIRDFKANYEILKNVEKISKQQALEVFTMLPEPIDPSVKSKLTEAPSILNKNIFDSTVNSVQNKIEKEIEDTIDKINDFNKFYIDIRDNKLAQLDNIVTNFLSKNEEAIRTILSSETKYLVIYDDKTYNLLIDTIETISKIDDTKIFYAPYEGKLTSLFLSLVYELNKEENVFVLSANKDSNLKTLFENIFKIPDIIKELKQYFDNKFVNNESIEINENFNIKISQLQKLVLFYTSLSNEKNILTVIEDLIKLFEV